LPPFALAVLLAIGAFLIAAPAGGPVEVFGQPVTIEPLPSPD
jgi:hypothetical protein